MQHMMVTNNCKKTTAQIGAHLCASQAHESVRARRAHACLARFALTRGLVGFFEQE